MRLASVTLLLASACTTPGTEFYGGDDTPIDNGGGGGSGGCTRITSVTPVAPLIQLVVDGSGTMNGNGGYNAVQNALYKSDGTGLLTTYASKAKYGATAYTSNGTCPNLHATPCAVDNMANVKTAIDAGKGVNGTDPLPETLTSLHGTYGAMTDKYRNIVIVTDGVANSCGGGGDGTNAVTDTTTLYADGVTTYIIGYGNLGNWGQNMANAGVGGSGGTLYTANDAAGVKTNYQTIFDLIIDCKLETDQAIDINGASSDTLSMDGTALVSGTDWKIVDDHTIQLIGTACTNYKAATTAPTFTASICGT
ncbi:MAG: VWA domain-containing protein [Kofleriaceae bacterium]